MTPDWAAKPTAVPYPNFGNPQSLNLYSYVENNPTTTGDPDGHCLEDACIAEFAAVSALITYTASPAGQRAIRNGLEALVNMATATGTGRVAHTTSVGAPFNRAFCD